MDIYQVELAEMVGVSKGFMSQVESGEKECSLWLVEKIAKVLRCDPDTLFKKVVKRKTRYVVRKR